MPHREIKDPFTDKWVKISDNLYDRLRGRYAVGPTLANGEPEFGWSEYLVPPIQREAADALDAIAGRPKAILAWAAATFGDYARKPDERARRLLEEAVELAQALGVGRENVGKIVERAYSRPAGDPAKEIAQVGMTLECLAAVLDVDLSAAIDGEFARVRAKDKAHWQERAAEKRAAGTEDVAK